MAFRFRNKCCDLFWTSNSDSNMDYCSFDVSGASMCDTLNVVGDECQSSYGEKIIINEAIFLTSDPEKRRHRSF